MSMKSQNWHVERKLHLHFCISHGEFREYNTFIMPILSIALALLLPLTMPPVFAADAGIFVR